MKHTHTVRVYYEDTDFGGRVYYANYLKFAERARTELLRSKNIVQTELMEAHGIGFVVRKCAIEFFKPAMMDDSLTIETLVDDITKATITMRQTIKKDAETLAELEVRIAVIGKENGKVMRLPDSVYTALKN